jgi:ankyrin repeat protein
MGDEFLRACRNGDFEKVIKGLVNGVNVNRTDEYGSTPLHWASLFGYAEVVKILLDVGADFNLADKYGLTLLHRASLDGRAEVVKILLDKGADFNLTDKYERTPLQYASWKGRVEVVKILLDAGADFNLADKDGRTLLHRASSSGRIEIVKILLNAGADINLVDNLGTKPIDVICSSGWAKKENEDVIRNLLEKWPTAVTLRTLCLRMIRQHSIDTSPLPSRLLLDHPDELEEASSYNKSIETHRTTSVKRKRDGESNESNKKQK